MLTLRSSHVRSGFGLLSFRNQFIAALAVLVCSGLICSVTAVAEDWPAYRGVDGNGRSVESLSSEGVSLSADRIIWKTKTPLGFSSFAIADGRLFTLVSRNDKEVCLALDAKTGNEVWSAELGSSKYPQGGGGAGAPDNKGGDGPRSTPSVSGGRVFAYDASMTLWCLEANSGDLVWKQDIIEDFGGSNIKWSNATSPVLHNDLVIVGGGGKGQSLLAFKQTDGKTVWKSGDETITHATPTVAKIDGQEQVIFFTRYGLVSVKISDGSELWRTEFKFSTSTAASPVVDGNLVYCSAGYGVGAGLFRIIDNKTVEEIWFKSNELMNHWSTPLVHDGHLYGIFEFKKYGRAPLQCVELATGEIKWEKRGFGPGNCILVGDKLVVLSDAGEVVVAVARSDEYQELGRAKILDGKCWSTPAISEGQVYVRSTQEAARVSLTN